MEITQSTRGIRSASTSTGWRVSGQTVVRGDANSTTLSKQPIIEIPEETLPDATPDTVIDQLSGLVLESELTEEETQAILSPYPAWEDYSVGAVLEVGTILSHGSTLYKVNIRHNKQTDYIPGVALNLFSVTFSNNVIPVWFQPSGAQDAWPLNALVQWPEGGKIWRSTIPANTTEPGTLIPWGYWVEHVES